MPMMNAEIATDLRNIALVSRVGGESLKSGDLQKFRVFMSSRKIDRKYAGCEQSKRPASFARVALFEPWIATVVVAERLPEPRLVAVDDAQAAHPFGALPEIEMRHDQPHRAAMLARSGASPAVARRSPSAAKSESGRLVV